MNGASRPQSQSYQSRPRSYHHKAELCSSWRLLHFLLANVLSKTFGNSNDSYSLIGKNERPGEGATGRSHDENRGAPWDNIFSVFFNLQIIRSLKVKCGGSIQTLFRYIDYE